MRQSLHIESKRDSILSELYSSFVFYLEASTTGINTDIGVVEIASEKNSGYLTTDHGS